MASSLHGENDQVYRTPNPRGRGREPKVSNELWRRGADVQRVQEGPGSRGTGAATASNTLPRCATQGVHPFFASAGAVRWVLVHESKHLSLDARNVDELSEGEQGVTINKVAGLRAGEAILFHLRVNQRCASFTHYTWAGAAQDGMGLWRAAHAKRRAREGAGGISPQSGDQFAQRRSRAPCTPGGGVPVRTAAVVRTLSFHTPSST